jgi:hypothetical protein
LKNSLTWLQFGLKILSFLEATLPAFLVAWNGRLQNKVKQLESEIAIAKYHLRQAEVKARVESEHAGKSDRAVIDDFLNDPGPSD